MTHPVAIDSLDTDILVLGAGGAGLCAALHAADRAPGLSITVVVKGLLGRAGCTRMVQGGYNAVLAAPDSIEAHFADTLEGGAWINDQELAWTLVTEAPGRVLELEARYGCFFDRQPDGRIHQKPFAGQRHDRTIHKGDLTGIEIMNRLSEQVGQRPSIGALEEHRAIELLRDDAGGVAGALCLDIRRGVFVTVSSRATLMAMGGGPTMYRIFACSTDKAADGIALGFRAGLRLRDMEMVQFHPTGLIVPNSVTSGTLLEEGLRGAGGHLLNGRGERFMARYDARRMERSTRDLVARASFTEVLEGRGTPNGGVWIDVSHLGAETVERSFRGMVKRCREFGYDLARVPVEVGPTSHFMMGGIAIDTACRTDLDGLFAAGEDTGGVHGANRLGGNGVADSIVYGARAGDSMADFVAGRSIPPLSEPLLRELSYRWAAPLGRDPGENVFELRSALENLMWEKVGVVRNGTDLEQAVAALCELRCRAENVKASGPAASNPEWNEALNLVNLCVNGEMVARSALVRTESRGAHYRQDFPKTDPAWLRNIYLEPCGQEMRFRSQPVEFTRLTPPEYADNLRHH